MSALRLAVMNNRKAIRKARGGSGSNGSNTSSVIVSATPIVTDDIDIHLNPEYDNDDNIFFYTAAADGFDHSPTVREYFHHDRSRISSNNKSLWPLCYKAYKEYGI
jgi:hypothetical protein